MATSSAPSFPSDWLARPLSAAVVRLVRFPLSLTEEERVARRGVLSPDEIARADRFVREVDRIKFTAARSALRIILGGLLDRPAEAVAFDYTPRGKPFLPEGSCGGLAFNLSHTDGCAVVALSRDRHLGVDVERIRPEFEIEATARWVFSAAEQEQFFAAPASERRALFFAHWTRKEALFKGVGLGIGGGLTETTVAPLAPSTPGSECCVAHSTARGLEGWIVRDAVAPAGYAAAVACEGSDWTLEHCDWP